MSTGVCKNFARAKSQTNRVEAPSFAAAAAASWTTLRMCVVCACGSVGQCARKLPKRVHANRQMAMSPTTTAELVPAAQRERIRESESQSEERDKKESGHCERESTRIVRTLGEVKVFLCLLTVKGHPTTPSPHPLADH